jgi:hypothetical protein
LALKELENPEPIPQRGPSWACYWGDLKTSARLLWASPFLVLLTAALFAAFELGAHRAPPRALWALSELAAGVFLAGFTGTERVWFVRKLRRTSIQPSEVWGLSWRFFWRFVRLGLLASIVYIPAIAVIVATTHRQVASHPRPISLGGDAQVATIATVLVLDFLGTFVVPALSLSVSTVGQSLRLGWRVTKQLWPTNAWYLFAPGLTVTAIVGILPASTLPLGTAVVVGVVSTMLGLWFKGAISAFYLRSFPQTADDGATSQ